VNYRKSPNSRRDDSYSIIIINSVGLYATSIANSTPSCAAISIWRISVLVSIIKKGTSRLDMNNFRGINILQYFRQAFAACCIPELRRVASRVISPLQQGFLKGRKMWVAYMALYALIENGRCSGRTVFVTFIDVKKAFPSVCREILWRELFNMGVDPGVLRTLVAHYDNTQAPLVTISVMTGQVPPRRHPLRRSTWTERDQPGTFKPSSNQMPAVGAGPLGRSVMNLGR